MKLGFIGCGVMANAMMGGIIRNGLYKPEDIWGADPFEGSREKTKAANGINVTDSNEEVIKNCGFVFDVIYNPERTKLMQTAENYGIKTCGGMAMLVWQAVVAHEIWSGAKDNDNDIAKLISDMHKLMAEKE